MLIIRRLVIVFQLFKLALLQLPMVLWRQNSLFLIPKLWLDSITSWWGCNANVILVSKVHELHNKIQASLTRMPLNRLVIYLKFWPYFLILLPGNIVKCGLCSSSLITPLRRLFLLMTLYVFMIIPARIWHRFSNAPHLAWHSLQPLFMVAKPLASGLNFKSSLCQIWVVHLWQRGPTWYLIRMSSRWQVIDVFVKLVAQQILGRKEALGVAFLMLYSL